MYHGASCPWGELSVGRNVRGASYRGANCPWGELSVGRNVRGASRRGESFRGASCPGASFDGASGPGTFFDVIIFVLAFLLSFFVNISSPPTFIFPEHVTQLIFSEVYTTAL
jgi:hypothetical protein